jgi:hypothetical protein
MLTFDPQQEKETYQYKRNEILGMHWIESTSFETPVVDMPLIYDHTTLERPLEKESTLKDFMISCLELMKDETTWNELHRMIDHCVQERDLPTA